MIWHGLVKEKLEKLRIFKDVKVIGAKVRAVIDEKRFLELYFDTTTGSYSYGLIDLSLPTRAIREFSDGTTIHMRESKKSGS